MSAIQGRSKGMRELLLSGAFVIVTCDDDTGEHDGPMGVNSI